MEISTLFVRQNDRHQKIRIEDIRYISAAGSYLEIVTMDGKFSASQNLSEFARRHSIETLLRVHRSYIVNMSKIDSFDHEHVYIGSVSIPIGATYREKFMKEIHCL